jgi:hypothetical protein
VEFEKENKNQLVAKMNHGIGHFQIKMILELFFEPIDDILWVNLIQDGYTQCLLNQVIVLIKVMLKN